MATFLKGEKWIQIKPGIGKLMGIILYVASAGARFADSTEKAIRYQLTFALNVE